MNSVRRHNLFRSQPTAKRIEGIPCGNGTVGAMAWGGPGELILSLDRSDLWYNCPAHQERRITAGALIFDCGAGNRFEEGLDLLEAVACRDLAECRFEWFVHAEEGERNLRNPSRRQDGRRGRRNVIGKGKSGDDPPNQAHALHSH